MSVQAITLAFAQTRVTWAEKFLLVTLANYADPKMVCWPSQATLAKDTRMTDRGIRKLLAGLEQKGLIKRKARYAPVGRSSDLIMLTMDPAPDPEPRSASEHSGSGTPGTTFRHPPEPRSGKPSVEPIREPLARDAPLAPDGAARSLGKEKKFPPPTRPKETRAEMAARLRRLV